MGKDKESDGDIIKFTLNKKYRKKNGKDRSYEQTISCKKGTPTCTVTENDNGDKTTKEMSQTELFNSLIQVLQGEVGKMFGTEIPLATLQKALQGPDIPDHEKYQMLLMNPVSQQQKATEIPDNIANLLGTSSSGLGYNSLEPNIVNVPLSDDQGSCPVSDGTSGCPFAQPYLFNDEPDAIGMDDIIRNQSVPDIRVLLQSNDVPGSQESPELVQNIPIQLLRAKLKESADQSDENTSGSDSDSDSDHSAESIIQAIQESREQPVPDSSEHQAKLNGESDSDGSNTSIIEALELARKHQSNEPLDTSDSDDSHETPDWIQQIEGDTQKQLLEQLMKTSKTTQNVSQKINPTMLPASKLKLKSKEE